VVPLATLDQVPSAFLPSALVSLIRCCAWPCETTRRMSACAPLGMVMYLSRQLATSTKYTFCTLPPVSHDGFSVVSSVVTPLTVRWTT